MAIVHHRDSHDNLAPYSTAMANGLPGAGEVPRKSTRGRYKTATRRSEKGNTQKTAHRVHCALGSLCVSSVHHTRF